MHRVSILVPFLLLTLFAPAALAADLLVGADDWPFWRGPDRNGVAPATPPPPTEWSAEQNVLWKVPVPGRGSGSPTIVGDRIYLATADEETQIQSVIAFDRDTGEQLWQTTVHEGGFESEGRQGHPRSTKASSTVACDGERVYINFINNNAVYTTALTVEGEQVWQKKVTDYVIHQGYGSSPTIYGDLVIVSADNKGGGAIKAFDRESGAEVWTIEREALPNYTSPIILQLNGRDELIFTGHDKISSFSPANGETYWEVDGATTECVTSVITDGQHIVTSGGYPEKHIAVVKADGSGETVWRNGTEVYVPSMIAHEGHFYGVTDAGEVFCYAFDNETPVWTERVRGKFAASPILVGDLLYLTGMRGEGFIIKASPAGFELVAQNELPASNIEATPAICGGNIYLRTTERQEAGEQEYLYCIGE